MGWLQSVTRSMFLWGIHMKNFKVTKVLVGAALVASAGAAGAMNIVVNPSFELGAFDSLGATGAPGVTGVGNYNGAGDPFRRSLITDWTVTQNKLIWIDNNYGGVLTADDGARFLDLTALTGGEVNYATIAQTLNTAVNTTYMLTFAVGSSNAITGNPNVNTRIEVKAGNLSQTFNLGVAGGPNVWTPITAYFTTSGVQTNLSMTFRGVEGDDYIGLDTISVTAIPEPTSLALLFAGLAAVGTVVRRRRGQNN